jgi:hypothetical protein
MIRKYFRNINEIQLKNKELIEEGIALNKINQLIDNNFFPTTNFSLKNYMILHVVNELLINQRKTVLEFGSGYSTFVLNQLINKFNLNIQVFSVDQDEDWIKFLSSNYNLNNIQFIHAKLNKNFEHKNKSYFWYDTNEINSYLNDKKIDLVLIDGPKAGIEKLKYSRLYAAEFLKSNISDDCAIFLDDTNRFAEQEIIEIWSKFLDIEFIKKHNYSYSRIDSIHYSSIPL